MLLAVDVGNTNLVLGAFTGTELKRTWRLPTRTGETGDSVRATLHALLAAEGLGAQDFEMALISSVVPRMTALLGEAFAGLKLESKVITYQWPFSFTNSAARPETVGMDRLVNAEAAVREHEGPLVIVDSGTATTLCAVTRDRRYLGGAILPGMELGMETLAKRTALLFDVALQPPRQAIGRDTEEALKSGLVLGYASMVDGMVARFRAEMKEPHALVIATGGVSRLLRGHAQSLEVFDSDLTLKGIRYLHESFRRL
ncbi:MAG: type III pantothenate kinase [Bdellovibrionales bacterium]|nr:type III pantothenate kinase [Bdellovibrionales bacterium]